MQNIPEYIFLHIGSLALFCTTPYANYNTCKIYQNTYFVKLQSKLNSSVLGLLVMSAFLQRFSECRLFSRKTKYKNKRSLTFILFIEELTSWSPCQPNSIRAINFNKTCATRSKKDPPDHTSHGRRESRIVMDTQCAGSNITFSLLYSWGDSSIY